MNFSFGLKGVCVKFELVRTSDVDLIKTSQRNERVIKTNIKECLEKGIESLSQTQKLYYLFIFVTLWRKLKIFQT